MLLSNHRHLPSQAMVAIELTEVRGKGVTNHKLPMTEVKCRIDHKTIVHIVYLMVLGHTSMSSIQQRCAMRPVKGLVLSSFGYILFTDQAPSLVWSKCFGPISSLWLPAYPRNIILDRFAFTDLYLHRSQCLFVLWPLFFLLVCFGVWLLVSTVAARKVYIGPVIHAVRLDCLCWCVSQFFSFVEFFLY